MHLSTVSTDVARSNRPCAALRPYLERTLAALTLLASASSVMLAAPAVHASSERAASPVAQAAPNPAPQPSAEELEAAIEGHGGQPFWGAVLVARRGVPILARGYGFANVPPGSEDDPEVEARPINPDTLFDVGSITKQFTAASILLLAQRGKLSIDDPLSKFFPQDAATATDITLRHLMSHTSGVQEESIDHPYNMSREQRVSTFAAAPRTRVPGDAFRYSNVGYSVLAAVVEVVSQRTFQEFVCQEIFKPAGMLRSGLIGNAFDGVGVDGKLDISNAARRFEVERATGLTTPVSKPITWDGTGWGFRGCTGALTSLNDLLAWERALRNGTVLDPAHVQLFFEPVPGARSAQGAYSLGWNIGFTDTGERVISHGGTTRGFSAFLAIYPDSETIITILVGDQANQRYNASNLERVLWRAGASSLELNVASLPLNQHAAARLPIGTRWHVEPQATTGHLTLALTFEENTLARWTFPESLGRKIAFDLENVLADRRGRQPLTRFSRGPQSLDADAPPGTVEGMIGTIAYTQALEGQPPTKLIQLQGRPLRAKVMPSHRSASGGGHFSSKITIAVDDADRSFWPLIISITDDDAATLARQLDRAN
ncbi:MAG: serine hydrolase domain-containing protein [Planctomycetota bacterium]|nr:serine hydrolase domain-containing protein [Planctomycetota bacterium]